MGVRPIQFWELVFPKEHLDTVLNSIANPQPWGTKQRWAVAALRAMLKAREVPEWNKQVPKLWVFHDAVEFNPIGIRDDPIHPDGGHEML